MGDKVMCLMMEQQPMDGCLIVKRLDVIQSVIDLRISQLMQHITDVCPAVTSIQSCSCRWPAR
jgi:hypothetical protein